MTLQCSNKKQQLINSFIFTPDSMRVESQFFVTLFSFLPPPSSYIKEQRNLPFSSYHRAKIDIKSNTALRYVSGLPSAFLFSFYVNPFKTSLFLIFSKCTYTLAHFQQKVK